MSSILQCKNNYYTLWQNLDYWTLTNNNFNLEKKDREQAVSRTGQKIRPEVLNCSYHKPLHHQVQL